MEKKKIGGNASLSIAIFRCLWWRIIVQGILFFIEVGDTEHHLFLIHWFPLEPYSLETYILLLKFCELQSKCPDHLVQGLGCGYVLDNSLWYILGSK